MLHISLFDIHYTAPAITNYQGIAKTITFHKKEFHVIITVKSMVAIRPTPSALIKFYMATSKNHLRNKVSVIKGYIQ